MKLKAEYKRRLEKVFVAIGRAIRLDAENKAEFAGSLIPLLFQLLAYLWMKSRKDLYKK